MEDSKASWEDQKDKLKQILLFFKNSGSNPDENEIDEMLKVFRKEPEKAKEIPIKYIPLI